MKMFNKIQSNKTAFVGKSVFEFDDENINSQSISKYDSKYDSKTVSENKTKNQFKRIVSMSVSTSS